MTVARAPGGTRTARSARPYRMSIVGGVNASFMEYRLRSRRIGPAAAANSMPARPARRHPAAGGGPLGATRRPRVEFPLPRTPPRRTRHESAAARQSPVRQGLHRRARPERRQHAEGAHALRHQAGHVLGRRRDVRPGPRDAHAHRHQPGLHRRPHPRRDPVRADDGPRRRGARHGRLPLVREAGRAVPEGRQGPGGRSQRRADDEADPGPRCAARPRQDARASSAPRCAR